MSFNGRISFTGDDKKARLAVPFAKHVFTKLKTRIDGGTGANLFGRIRESIPGGNGYIECIYIADGMSSIHITATADAPVSPVYAFGDCVLPDFHAGAIFPGQRVEGPALLDDVTGEMPPAKLGSMWVDDLTFKRYRRKYTAAEIAALEREGQVPGKDVPKDTPMYPTERTHSARSALFANEADYEIALMSIDVAAAHMARYPRYYQPWFIKSSMYTGEMRKIVQLLLGLGNNRSSDSELKWVDTAKVSVELTEEAAAAIKQSEVLRYLSTEGTGVVEQGDKTYDRVGPTEIHYDFRFSRTHGVFFAGEPVEAGIYEGMLNGPIKHVDGLEEHGLPTHTRKAGTTGRMPWLVEMTNVGAWAIPLPLDPAFSQPLVMAWMRRALDIPRTGDAQEAIAFAARSKYYNQLFSEVLDVFGGMPSGQAFPTLYRGLWERAGVLIELWKPKDSDKIIQCGGYATSAGWAFNAAGNRIAGTGYYAHYTNGAIPFGCSWEGRVKFILPDDPDNPGKKRRRQPGTTPSHDYLSQIPWKERDGTPMPYLKELGYKYLTSYMLPSVAEQYAGVLRKLLTGTDGQLKAVNSMNGAEVAKFIKAVEKVVNPPIMVAELKIEQDGEMFLGNLQNCRWGEIAVDGLVSAPRIQMGTYIPPDLDLGKKTRIHVLFNHEDELVGSLLTRLTPATSPDKYVEKYAVPGVVASRWSQSTQGYNPTTKLSLFPKDNGEHEIEFSTQDTNWTEWKAAQPAGLTIGPFNSAYSEPSGFYEVSWQHHVSYCATGKVCRRILQNPKYQRGFTMPLYDRSILYDAEYRFYARDEMIQTPTYTVFPAGDTWLWFLTYMWICGARYWDTHRTGTYTSYGEFSNAGNDVTIGASGDYGDTYACTSPTYGPVKVGSWQRYLDENPETSKWYKYLFRPNEKYPAKTPVDNPWTSSERPDLIYGGGYWIHYSPENGGGQWDVEQTEIYQPGLLMSNPVLPVMQNWVKYDKGHLTVNIVGAVNKPKVIDEDVTATINDPIPDHIKPWFIASPKVEFGYESYTYIAATHSAFTLVDKKPYHYIETKPNSSDSFMLHWPFGNRANGFPTAPCFIGII